MDQVDNIIETAPDSALTILESINVGGMAPQKEKARYAILKSMAYDKNYIDTISFEVIQPAIDYYLKKGNPDEKLRTLYYQGRIYQNRNEDEEAMKCFIKATELKDEITDSLILGRTYDIESILYFKQRRIESYIKNAILAANIYDKLNKHDFKQSCLLNALEGYIILNNREQADSLMKIIKYTYRPDDDYSYTFHHNQIIYGNEYFTDSHLKNLLDSLSIYPSNNDIKLDLAIGYSKIGLKSKALSYLDSVKKGKLDEGLKYYSIESTVLENSQDYNGSLKALKSYIKESDSLVSDLLSRDILFVEKKYALEKSIIIEKQRKKDIINYSLIFGLILCMLITLVSLRLRVVKIRKLKAEKEQFQLANKLKIAGEENNKIKREKDSIEEEKLKLKKEVIILNTENEKIKTERNTLNLESENIRKNLERLITEREQLTQIIEKQAQISSDFKELVKDRLDILNALISSHLSVSRDYLKTSNNLLQKATKDKEKFLETTKLLYISLYPEFMRMLETKGLSELEIKYICLYALGLKGKDIGEYLQTKRHYIISSEIRSKLGLSQNDTNLGLFIASKLR